MKDIDPFHVIPIEGINGGVLLVIALRSNQLVIDLQGDKGLIASEEFSDATVWGAVRLLVRLKRLRRGENGTLHDLARFMQRQARGDSLLFNRLATDFDMPVDHWVVLAWRLSGHWPSADEFRRTMDILPEESREYLLAKAYVAVKHGEIKDEALVEYVKSLRQQSRPQPKPEQREEEAPKKKRRSLLHPRGK